MYYVSSVPMKTSATRTYSRETHVLHGGYLISMSWNFERYVIDMFRRFRSPLMGKLIQMKLIVNVGRVAIFTRDAMVSGVALMEKMKKTVHNRCALQALFLVYLHTITLYHVCQQIKLAMDISIVSDL
jgi:hypothetical protein